VPGWSQILGEIQQSAAERGPNGPDLDGIRLKYIQRLHKQTGRAVIVYASGWLHSTGRQEFDHLVNGKDVHAIMEACHEVPERSLDLIVHSPGGLPSSAEQLVRYLRTRFDNIRAIIPLQAKSAATMIALGCDEILLGAHSELGPIDPQIPMPVPEGQRFSPALAILRDFERAKREIGQNVNTLPAWTPILHAYAGGLLEFCDQQIKLSQELVSSWMEQYMLVHEDVSVPEEERHDVAEAIGRYFGSEEAYDRFREHGRPIRIEELQQLRGLRVRRLEDDQDVQDTVLSIYHALDFTLGAGAVLKIVENHLGKRYVRIHQQILVQSGPPPPEPPAQQARGSRPPRPPQPQHHPAAQRPTKRRSTRGSIS
jgi:hypothetical protein